MKMVVNNAVYAHGKKLRDIEIDQISQALETPDAFVWIGLHEPTEEILKQLQTQLPLHDLAIEDAHNAHQRPKIEEYGNSLFVVLRTAEMVKDDVHLGETHIFVGPQYVVSVRHGSLIPYTSVRERCESSPELLSKGPSYVLYSLMDFIVDHYFPIVDALEEELEEIEVAVFRESSVRNTTQRIYNLKRDLIALRKGVSPLVGICGRLFGQDVHLISDDIRPYFRDVFDHVNRIHDNGENMREMLTTAL
jgi:magnesium transporter